ncbi:hypothetical protein Tco_0455330 [Tanacetum coccineum]
MEILPVLISNTTAVGDMGDLEKDQTCDNWKSKAIQITEIDQALGISLVQHDAEIQERHEDKPEFDFDAANIPVTTTGAEISIVSPEVKTAGDSIEDIPTETFVYIRRSAAKAKDKAVRLQAELDKEERQRISRAEGLIQELLQKIFIQAERSRR